MKSKRILCVGAVVILMMNTIVSCSSNGRDYNLESLTTVSEISEEQLLKMYAVSPRNESLEDAPYIEIVLSWLEEDLWTKRDMYDATHNLMIPMHYSFQTQNEKAIKGFANFFERYMKDVTGADRYQFKTEYTLGHLHFFYLCTQFMNLCAANSREDLIPEGLDIMPRECAENYIFHSEAIWSTEPTVFMHLQNIIAGKEYEYNYYSSFADPERFALAILCDLKYFDTLRGGGEADEKLIIAAELAYELLSSKELNEETDCGGWLFQVGVGSDFPDNLYAGNETVYEGMEPNMREDIAEDTSHAHRWPLLLRSYQSAQSMEERYDLFELRLKQLANQMIGEVLKNVDGYWLTTTFMDGTNGVYRYSYDVENIGLSGYELSSTFLVGWWSMLKDERISEIYSEILVQIHKSNLIWDESNPYYNETAALQDRNPYFDSNLAFENGMIETLVFCASEIR